MKDCKLCGETGEVVNRPSRLMGATYWGNDSGDERLEPCPICRKGEMRGGCMTMAKTKTEELREEIAVCSRDDAYDALGMSKYNKGWRSKEHHLAYLVSADKVLKACKKAGMVMLSENQTGLPTYLVDAPNIRRVEEIEV